MEKGIISDRRRLFEIVAVVITAIGKFIFMDYLNWRFPYILTAIGFWVFYILLSMIKDRSVSSNWGFRRDNFNKVFRLMAPIAFSAMLVLVIIGFLMGTLNITWHILPVLLFYPLWPL